MILLHDKYTTSKDKIEKFLGHNQVTLTTVLMIVGLFVLKRDIKLKAL